jgi:hypothetical protein
MPLDECVGDRAGASQMAETERIMGIHQDPDVFVLLDHRAIRNQKTSIKWQLESLRSRFIQGTQLKAREKRKINYNASNGSNTASLVGVCGIS